MPNEKRILCNVKLTEDERNQLRKDAYAHFMNVSEYLRWLIERERTSAKEVSKEEREREICRRNYAAQLEGLGYNADGTAKVSE